MDDYQQPEIDELGSVEDFDGLPMEHSRSDEKAPFWTLKPYWDVANETEEYVGDLGLDLASDLRSLGWIALGGRGGANPEFIADRLETVALNAESLAEEVRKLDDPREVADAE